jgi:hypothetical protein
MVYSVMTVTQDLGFTRIPEWQGTEGKDSESRMARDFSGERVSAKRPV